MPSDESQSRAEHADQRAAFQQRQVERYRRDFPAGEADDQVAAVPRHAAYDLLGIIRADRVVGDVDAATLQQRALRWRGSSTPLWTEPGPAASGVSLPGPTRHFTFAPEGFTLGLSNASLRLARGSATRTVVFSRLGRVRLLP